MLVSLEIIGWLLHGDLTTIFIGVITPTLVAHCGGKKCHLGLARASTLMANAPIMWCFWATISRVFFMVVSI